MSNLTIQQAIKASKELKANADKQIEDYTKISNYYADLIAGLEASINATPSTPSNKGSALAYDGVEFI